MATHSSVLAWRIPGTGEPGGLPSIGSHKVGHNWSDLAAAAAAERTYRTAHRSHEVLAWSRGALLHTSVRAPPQGPGCCGVGATLEWHRGHLLLYYGDVAAAATAAASASREAVLRLPCPPGENTCLQFLSLLESPSNPLAWALPTLGSANSAHSVNSETTGITNRMKSNTKIQGLIFSYFNKILKDKVWEQDQLCLPHYPDWSSVSDSHRPAPGALDKLTWPAVHGFVDLNQESGILGPAPSHIHCISTPPSTSFLLI